MSVVTEYLKPKSPKKIFKAFAFWSPLINDEQYMWVKECGYTHLYIDAKYGALFGTEQLKNAVELCGRYGLNGIVNISKFSTDVNDYSNTLGFGGANNDEPLTEQELADLSDELDNFNKKYPNDWFYVNCPGGIYGDAGEAYLDVYEEKLTKKMKNKSISSDDYPLAPDPHKSRLKKFYPCLQTIAKYAKETGSEFYFFLQTMSISTFGIDGARRPSYIDLLWNHNILLAYGVDGFQHFCYKGPGLPPYECGEFREQDWALIDNFDKRTRIWYDVQSVLRTIQDFADVYFDFKWQDVIYSYGNKTTVPDMFALTEGIKSFSAVKSVSSDYNAVVGCFSHSDKSVSAVYIVSCEDPSFRRPCNVTLHLDRDYDVVLICGEERRRIKSVNSRLVVSADEGKGIFVIFEGVDNNTCVGSAEVKSVLVDLDGVLTFKSKSDCNILYINGCKLGAVKSGDNISDKLKNGCNEVYISAVDKEAESKPSRIGRIFVPSKDNVDVCEQYDGDLSAVETYNVYGSGNTVLNIVDGFTSGKSIEVSTQTVKGHDWSCFQFLTAPIRYERGKNLYLHLKTTSSVYNISIGQDPMQNIRSVEFKTMGKSGKKLQVAVPLHEINPEEKDIIEKLYIVTGGDKPYGTLMWLDGYYIDK